MYVRKRSGELEPFDRRKAIRAIVRTGASEEEADQMIDRLLPSFHEGITTVEIYRAIRRELDNRKRLVFGIKQSVFDLGPEGHVFEDYIGRVMECLGYDVRLRQFIDGECLRHEVDAIVEKDGIRHMVECKFHNSQGTRCNSQVAMYTQARFLDLNGRHKLHSPWLITNTGLSADALRYACCMGMKVLSWNDPEGEGLQDIIHRYRLYPLTATGMSAYNRDKLVANGIILASDLVANEDRVLKLLPKSTARRIIQMAKALPGACEMGDR
jgi:hypothetical protein